MKAYIEAHYAVLCPQCSMMMARDQRALDNAPRISVSCVNYLCSELGKSKTYERLSVDLEDA